ncbi:P-loop containing nucleoside triphosphate hydrolase protein [Pelagophyceae sp. CCMP2097]|nr:P-loop containing nucleoside triphosphate hydrolase protein [Pelagophyceae sp. CCMP2097]
MGATQSMPEFKEVDVSDYIDEVEAADVGYNLALVRGVPQNPLFDVAMFEDLIDKFETRNDDVFICTYVKAGTTWCQQIVTLLLNDGEQGDLSYGEQVPWLEALCAPDTLAHREAPGHSRAIIDATEGPRYFKSHATVADLPRGAAPGVRIVAVARNPKDTVVSLFHHASSKPEFGYTGDFETFLRIFLTGHAENGSWFKHAVEWHQYSIRHPQHCLWLTYEQMIADHRGAVVQIAKFLGKPTRGPTIDRTVANSTMKSMKSNKKANIGLNHLRRGGIGGWRDYFTVSQSNCFDAAKLAGHGLRFNFGEGEEF